MFTSLKSHARLYKKLCCGLDKANLSRWCDDSGLAEWTGNETAKRCFHLKPGLSFEDVRDDIHDKLEKNLRANVDVDVKAPRGWFWVEAYD